MVSHTKGRTRIEGVREKDEVTRGWRKLHNEED
jgi:hypothetical protein